MEIYERKRTRRLLRSLIRYVALVAFFLVITDLIGEEQVEGFVKDISQDELPISDNAWFAGKLIGGFPCLGAVSGWGTTMRYVTSHKLKGKVGGSKKSFAGVRAKFMDPVKKKEVVVTSSSSSDLPSDEDTD